VSETQGIASLQRFLLLISSFLFGNLNKRGADKASLFANLFPHSTYHTFLNMSDPITNYELRFYKVEGRGMNEAGFILEIRI